MSEVKHYIGIPNGVVFCLDEEQHHGLFRGRLYHGYHDGPIEVASFLEMTQVMEHLFNELQFPRAGLRDRSFIEEDAKAGDGRRKEKERIMSDKELLAQHGELGTFIIRVQQRQAGTWQGRVTWVDQNKTIRFRSIFELIKLMESGIISEHPELAENEDPSWD